MMACNFSVSAAPTLKQQTTLRPPSSGPPLLPSLPPSLLHRHANSLANKAKWILSSDDNGTSLQPYMPRGLWVVTTSGSFYWLTGKHSSQNSELSTPVYAHLCLFFSQSVKLYCRGYNLQPTRHVCLQLKLKGPLRVSDQISSPHWGTYFTFQMPSQQFKRTE